MPACVLHNFFIEQQPSSYAPIYSTYHYKNVGGIACTNFDTSESNMIALDLQNPGNCYSDAKQLRDKFSSYFMSECIFLSGKPYS